MTRYIVYFEPVEIDADNMDDAQHQYDCSHIYPKILKIIPAEFVFDCDPEEEKVT